MLEHIIQKLEDYRHPPPKGKLKCELCRGLGAVPCRTIDSESGSRLVVYRPCECERTADA